ncbi:MAG: UDP-N-acetylmuramate dehydrogenase [Ruminococcaceae bacterium]|nr:UDP-N-acetylmuramate dehydrogenase [Oscillospiraceae bacterium]
MERLRDTLLLGGVPFQTEYPLCEHSSFRIGGKAAVAAFPRTEKELLYTLESIRLLQVRYLLMGKASNVVFSDEGFSGVVVFTTSFCSSSVSGNLLRADSGVTLFSLATSAERAGLSGLEFAHGIPGTLGGALVMNAGAYGGCMSDVCVSSSYFNMETGKIETVTGDAHAFGYRASIYMTHPEYVVLGAEIALHDDDPALIRERMEDLKQRRRSSQPLELPSAGSVFKRPVGHFAGKLIEDCGLKGLTVGGAEVSKKHAGFIVNRGGATAKDVRCLVEKIQETVLQRYGVELECEIRFL